VSARNAVSRGMMSQRRDSLARRVSMLCSAQPLKASVTWSFLAVWRLPMQTNSTCRREGLWRYMVEPQEINTSSDIGQAPMTPAKHGQPEGNRAVHGAGPWENRIRWPNHSLPGTDGAIHQHGGYTGRLMQTHKSMGGKHVAERCHGQNTHDH
jgi:hypothetical protein